MGERHFRFILGLALLAILYFDNAYALWGLIGYLTYEGLTNWRLPILVSKLRYNVSEPITQMSISIPAYGSPSYSTAHNPEKSGFEAERMLRFVLAGALVLSYFVFRQEAWLVPWFIGFALVSAGLSGICMTVIILKKIGFR